MGSEGQTAEDDRETVATCRRCDADATRMVEVDPTPKAGSAFVAPACEDHAQDAPVVEILDGGGDESQNGDSQGPDRVGFESLCWDCRNWYPGHLDECPDCSDSEDQETTLDQFGGGPGAE